MYFRDLLDYRNCAKAYQLTNNVHENSNTLGMQQPLKNMTFTFFFIIILGIPDNSSKIKGITLAAFKTEMTFLRRVRVVATNNLCCLFFNLQTCRSANISSCVYNCLRVAKHSFCRIGS